MVDVSLLIKSGQCKRFLAKQQIVFAGETAESAMYVLLAGKVEVFKEDPHGKLSSSGFVLPGEAFGGREFFFGGSESVYEAAEDSIAFMVCESSFNQLAQLQPQVLFEVLKAAYAKPGEITLDSHKIGKKAASPPARVVEEPSVKETAPKPAPPAQPQAKAITPPPAPPQIAAQPAKHISAYGIFPEGHKSYPGIIKPEFAKVLFKKAYKCPFCGKAFDDYKVLQSKLYHSKPIRYDLRKYYYDFQSEWYDIITCPHCYYSMFYNYYSEPKSIAKAKIDNKLAEAKKLIKLDFTAERDIDYVFATHYLSFICAEGYSQNRRQICARLWGNLSWLYEDVGDNEMERFAAGKAAEAYEAVYMESNGLSPIQEQVTCLIISGMQYRAGLTRDLKKYLFIAKTSKAGGKLYSDLAEDLIELMHHDKSRR